MHGGGSRGRPRRLVPVPPAARGVSGGGDRSPPDGAIRGVDFLLGDFREEASLAALVEGLGSAGADLVLSDLAPNMGGMKAIDQPRAMHLAEMAFDLAGRVLVPAGAFVVKVFQEKGSTRSCARCGPGFETVRVRKPRGVAPPVARGLRGRVRASRIIQPIPGGSTQ